MTIILTPKLHFHKVNSTFLCLDTNDYNLKGVFLMKAYGTHSLDGLRNDTVHVEMTQEEYYNTFIDPTHEKRKGIVCGLSKTDLRDWVSNQGNYFYFLIYKQLMKDFPDCEGLLFKFIYLCTYGDYDNKGGLLSYNKHPLVYDDFYSILNLSKKRTDDTISELLNKELLIQEGDNYKPNPKYYTRGIIKGYVGEITRIFNKGMRELYFKSNYKEHNLLAHFIPLMPYVNLKYNVICSNPEETDIKKLKPFNLKQVADVFEIDQTNSYRFKKKLLSITVHGYNLMGYFTRDFGNGLLKCFIVNPYVFYKAPGIKDMESIGKLFDIPNNC